MQSASPILRLTLLISFVVFSSFATAQQPQPEKQATEQSWLYQLSLQGGAGWALTSEEALNGGVDGIIEPDDSGVAANLSLLFRPELFPSTRVYIDYQFYNYDDRQFHIPGVGLRYDFNQAHQRFQPYLKGGLAYFYGQWDKPPHENISTGRDKGESLDLVLQAGFDYYLTENLALGAALRSDFYDMGTQVVSNNQVTTLNDYGSIAVLASLTYRFGNAPQRIQEDTTDSDQDGVLDRYDTCPDTLALVPVNDNGCPLDAFELDLSLAFSKYKVANITTETQFPFARFMHKNQAYQVLITGHTDDIGSDKVNQKLSLQRADAAKQYLLEHGINTNRITVSGKGENAPIVVNDSKQHRSINRHIAVIFYRPIKVQK